MHLKPVPPRPQKHCWALAALNRRRPACEKIASAAYLAQRLPQPARVFFAAGFLAVFFFGAFFAAFLVAMALTSKKQKPQTRDTIRQS
jgi:hypothetical protein